MVSGLADSAAMGTGGGVVKEPAVQGVSEALPQQVLKTSPVTGEEGFEVSPYGSPQNDAVRRERWIRAQTVGLDRVESRLDVMGER